MKLLLKSFALALLAHGGEGKIRRRAEGESATLPPYDPTGEEEAQAKQSRPRQSMAFLPPEEVGAWETVVPEDNGAARGDLIGMHSVSAIVLPSGKILMTPGTGWRNDKDRTTSYTVEDIVKNGPPDKGLPGGYPNRDDDPFLMENMEFYYKHMVAGTYDPTTNEFFRVPHPKPVPDPQNPGRFMPTDLFCAGHIHLPDGNAWMVGGTQFYLPWFTGPRGTFVFDWVQDAEMDWENYDWTVMPENQPNSYDPEAESDTPWSFSGMMEIGRWYPSMVQLMDGRMVVVGGFRDLVNSSATDPETDMYLYEVNEAVDFFDYRKVDPSDLSKAWRHVDVGEMENSPFMTRLPEEDWNPITACEDASFIERQCEAHKNDTFKLYPRIYLMPDGKRIFFTRDGDFNSMRDYSAQHMRNTKFSYIMDVGTNAEEPEVSFERGPDLPRHTLNAANAVRDPNDPMRILISGGMANHGGYYGPSYLPATDPRCILNVGLPNEEFDIKLCNVYLGGRASRGVLTYRMPEEEGGIGSWEEEDNDFLGPDPNSERSMHYKIILPTKQLLAVCGGNFWMAHAVMNPVLFTPLEGGGYDEGQMVAPQIYERLYHNIAVLLADGRIFVQGGNPNRATFNPDEPIGVERNDGTTGQKKFNPDAVDVNTYFLHDGVIGKGQHRTNLAESWTAEIYSPPYLYIDGDRRTQITGMSLLSDGPDGFSFSQEIAGKTHYLLQSGLTVQMDLTNLPDPDVCTIEDGSLVLIKLSSVTHGWDFSSQLFDVPIGSGISNGESATDGFTGSLEFTAPSSAEQQILPGFYHLFYVDCRGKPAVAESVRFDDNVLSVRDRAQPPE